MGSQIPPLRRCPWGDITRLGTVSPTNQPSLLARPHASRHQMGRTCIVRRIPLRIPLGGGSPSHLIPTHARTRDPMAQRDIPWEALLDQPFLAQAFGYSTPEEVAGTCILLLFSTQQPRNLPSPEPREWAQAADRRRFKVLAPARTTKLCSKSRAPRINRPPPSPARLLPGGPGSIKEAE